MSSLAAFRFAAVLWVVWGAVHVFAGVMTMSLDTPAAVAGIADAVDSATLLSVEYPPAAGGIIDQHGWNLGWIGLTTLVCAVPLWRGQTWAVWVAALVGGMADLGYFLFIDLPGFANFLPGRVMTFVSATAVIVSVWGVWRRGPV